MEDRRYGILVDSMKKGLKCFWFLVSSYRFVFNLFMHFDFYILTFEFNKVFLIDEQTNRVGETLP